jgi:dTDP-4-amino-4,6-dideoxygalactose transaminase
LNARLDEIQAVVLRVKLPYLLGWNERRREIAARYNTLLQDVPVIPPSVTGDNCPIYHLYVIRAEKRDELQDFLKKKGVFTGIHYPIPCHQQKALEYLGYQKGDLPVTEKMAGEILSLPMYAEMDDQQIRYVADCIKEFVLKA